MRARGKNPARRGALKEMRLMPRADFFGGSLSRAAAGRAGLEALDSAGRIDDLIPTGVKRMAVAANFNLDLFLGGTDGKNAAARAGYFRFRKISRVYVFLHG